MSIPQPFKPPWWLRNRHVQTLTPVFQNLGPIIKRRRERVELPDGDFLDLDWYGVPKQTAALIIHGLGGSSHSHYVRSLQLALGEQGVASAALNLRGCSGEINRLAKSYHSGVTEDLDMLFAALPPAYRQLRWVAAGYSLGGNLLLKWLGEQGEQCPVAGAAAVSVPFDLSHAARVINHGIGRAYRAHLVSGLVTAFESKKAAMQALDPIEWDRMNALGSLRRVRTFHDFDAAVTAPLFGFSSAEDYYSQASAIGYTDAIRRPTLVIQAADDPLVPVAALPKPHQLSEQITLAISQHGGHVGFLTSLRGGCRWLAEGVAQWLVHCANTADTCMPH